MKEKNKVTPIEEIVICPRHPEVALTDDGYCFMCGPSKKEKMRNYGKALICSALGFCFLYLAWLLGA